MWKDERQVAEIKVQVETKGVWRKRMMVFLYLKSSTHNSLYQHYTGQVTLSEEEYDSLNIDWEKLNCEAEPSDVSTNIHDESTV